jgi:hypothetical protein
MRTVTFQSVLNGVAIRMGLDPRVNLNSNVAQAICEYVNSRVRAGWEKADWPELVIIEPRTPSSRLIAWNQSMQTVISDVFKVYRADPSQNPPPLDVYFYTDQAGIHIGVTEQIGSQVWVKYRGVPPLFTSNLWLSSSAGGTNAVGKLVYSALDGNVYAGKTSTNTTTDPSADSTNWTLVPFPYVISEYVKAAATSDTLREDGQTAKAQAEEQRSAAVAGDAANAVAPAEFDVLTQNIRMAARMPAMAMAGEGAK